MGRAQSKYKHRCDNNYYYLERLSVISVNEGNFSNIEFVMTNRDFFLRGHIKHKLKVDLPCFDETKRSKCIKAGYINSGP